MLTLLVVGVMDDARANIQGNGQVQLTFAEKFSQVCECSVHSPVCIMDSNTGAACCTNVLQFATCYQCCCNQYTGTAHRGISREVSIPEEQ